MFLYHIHLKPWQCSSQAPRGRRGRHVPPQPFTWRRIFLRICMTSITETSYRWQTQVLYGSRAAVIPSKWSLHVKNSHLPPYGSQWLPAWASDPAKICPPLHQVSLQESMGVSDKVMVISGTKNMIHCIPRVSLFLSMKSMGSAPSTNIASHNFSRWEYKHNVLKRTIV